MVETVSRTLAAALAVAVLSLVAAAPADAFGGKRDQYLAQIAAHKHFDAWPAQCSAGIRTYRADLPPEHAAEADPPACSIYLNRLWLADLKLWDAWDRPGDRFCLIYVHEFGHLLGLAHASNPRSLMAASPTRVPRACRNFDALRRR